MCGYTHTHIYINQYCPSYFNKMPGIELIFFLDPFRISKLINNYS